MTIRLACLDMAGTTVSDGGIVESAFRRAMSEVGYPDAMMDTALRHVHDTMGLPKGVVFAGLPGTAVDVDRAVASFDAAVMDEIAGGRVSAIAGADVVLDRLRSSGVAICLTTGFTPDVQQAIVTHLGWEPLVDLALAPGPGVRGRPYPDLVLTAVMRLEIDDVRDVAVAGDTANDLWTGSRAGTSIVCGVLTGAHGTAELAAAPHTHIVDSVTALPGLVADA